MFVWLRQKEAKEKDGWAAKLDWAGEKILGGHGSGGEGKGEEGVRRERLGVGLV